MGRRWTSCPRDRFGGQGAAIADRGRGEGVGRATAEKPERIDWYMWRGRYSPMLRFVLEDEDEQLFAADRWCFSGKFDDRISLMRGDALETLGRECFYEMM